MSKQFAEEQPGEVQGGQFVFDLLGAWEFIAININIEQEQLILLNARLRNEMIPRRPLITE